MSNDRFQCRKKSFVEPRDPTGHRRPPNVRSDAKKILQNIFNRGIRNLTDQNSLINPDPMVYLKTLYSNRFQKNCKMVESETI